MIAVLVCDWLHSVWTKSIVCKDDVLTGIQLFKSVLEDSACKLENFRFLVSRPDDRAILSGRSSVHYSIRSDDVQYCLDSQQYCSETLYEGTKLVKSTKLQMLILKFEEIKMLEHETFGEFYSKMSDLRNSMVSLGKPILDVKLI
jgi:hypothetical protein